MPQVVSFDNLEDEELEGHREEKGMVYFFIFYLCVLTESSVILL